jgi:hypothetical protein
MSFLPQGQPLLRFIPDLDVLLQDPDTYLRQRPVVVGPRRMYGLACLFALPGLAILGSCAFIDGEFGERIALGVGLLLGASIWLGWSLMMRGHSLVLSHEGVEVRYLDSTVWCPWSLFNVQGEPFVPDSDSPRTGLALPVAPEVIPFVELRHHETVVAQGVQVEGKQWRFTSSNEVILPARYEVAPFELGQLILKLGRRLGQELPRGRPPTEAHGLQQLDEIPSAPEPGGWITVPLSQLHFPPRCCSCGSSTSVLMPIRIEGSTDVFLRGLARPGPAADLSIPLCETCQEDHVHRVARGGSLGMSLGGLAGLLVVLGIAYFYREVIAILFIAGLLALAIGGLVGYLLGSALGNRLPVQIRHYNPSQGTLSLRFRDPDYAHLVLDTLREEARHRQQRRQLG